MELRRLASRGMNRDLAPRLISVIVWTLVSVNLLTLIFGGLTTWLGYAIPTRLDKFGLLPEVVVGAGIASLVVASVGLCALNYSSPPALNIYGSSCAIFVLILLIGIPENLYKTSNFAGGSLTKSIIYFSLILLLVILLLFSFVFAHHLGRKSHFLEIDEQLASCSNQLTGFANDNMTRTITCTCSLPQNHSQAELKNSKRLSVPMQSQQQHPIQQKLQQQAARLPQSRKLQVHKHRSHRAQEMLCSGETHASLPRQPLLPPPPALPMRQANALSLPAPLPLVHQAFYERNPQLSSLNIMSQSSQRSMSHSRLSDSSGALSEDESSDWPMGSNLVNYSKTTHSSPIYDWGFQNQSQLRPHHNHNHHHHHHQPSIGAIQVSRQKSGANERATSGASRCPCSGTSLSYNQPLLDFEPLFESERS